jgi:hypothetical protein
MTYRRLLRLILVIGGVVLTLTGTTACGGTSAAAPSRALPTQLVPTPLAGLSVSDEASGRKAFTAVGASSMVKEGKVLTLRRPDGSVEGALEIGLLKPKFDSADIEVRRGVRTNIETGQYRWFKVEGQWVGLQSLSDVNLYLWFPARGDLFEILQLRSSLPGQQAIVAQVIDHQREATRR